MNNTPKLVASSTLKSVSEWQNSKLIVGDVVTALRDVKSRAGTYAMIIGSISLLRSLLGSDVIDELMLLVFPVVAGKGKRLFDDSVSRLPLELVSEEVFPKGVVKLIYRPRRS